jgi:hypothetical protein
MTIIEVAELPTFVNETCAVPIGHESVYQNSTSGLGDAPQLPFFVKAVLPAKTVLTLLFPGKAFSEMNTHIAAPAGVDVMPVRVPPNAPLAKSL